MIESDSARCPECGNDIELDSYIEVGDIIYCPSCEAELKLTRLHPPAVRLVDKSDIEDIDYYNDDEGVEDEGEV